MPGAHKAIAAIDPDRCTGCGWCVAACPPHVLSLHTERDTPGAGKHSMLDDPLGCTGCALCAVRCPFDAIRMVRLSGSHATVAPDAV